MTSSGLLRGPGSLQTGFSDVLVPAGPLLDCTCKSQKQLLHHDILLSNGRSHVESASSDDKLHQESLNHDKVSSFLLKCLKNKLKGQ